MHNHLRRPNADKDRDGNVNLLEYATTETLKILVPAGSIRRFVRLEVFQP